MQVQSAFRENEAGQDVSDRQAHVQKVGNIRSTGQIVDHAVRAERIGIGHLLDDEPPGSLDGGVFIDQDAQIDRAGNLFRLLVIMGQVLGQFALHEAGGAAGGLSAGQAADHGQHAFAEVFYGIEIVLGVFQPELGFKGVTAQVAGLGADRQGAFDRTVARHAQADLGIRNLQFQTQHGGSGQHFSHQQSIYGGEVM